MSASTAIDDPETPPSTVTIAAFDFDLPEDWRCRMGSGVNFKVEMVLHVADAVQTPTQGLKWRCKWLEVRRLSD
jgi:hypothetical protein